MPAKAGLVLLLHLLHAGAARVVEAHGAGVEDIGHGLAVLRLGRGGEGALPGGVVDLHAGLDVVGVDVEQHALALVLHGHGLQLHAPGQEFRPFKWGVTR